MIYVINTRKNLFTLELKLHFKVEKICIIAPAVEYRGYRGSNLHYLLLSK